MVGENTTADLTGPAELSLLTRMNTERSWLKRTEEGFREDCSQEVHVLKKAVLSKLKSGAVE